jgi:CysZ protein
MIKAYLLTLSQLKDPKIFRPLCYATLFTTVCILGLLLIGAGTISWVLDLLNHTLNQWFGNATGIFRWVIQLIGASFVLLLGYFIFSGIHAAFLGIFIDDIFDAIQKRHYPESELNPPPSLLTGIIFSVRFIIFSLLINLIALPFYLLGWFIPPLGISMQIGVNGYLLGKEYGSLCRMRFEDNSAAKNSHIKEGVLASCIWMVPVLNLAGPVLLAGSVMHSQMKASKQIMK